MPGMAEIPELRRGWTVRVTPLTEPPTVTVDDDEYTLGPTRPVEGRVTDLASEWFRIGAEPTQQELDAEDDPDSDVVVIHNTQAPVIRWEWVVNDVYRLEVVDTSTEIVSEDIAPVQPELARVAEYDDALVLPPEPPLVTLYGSQMTRDEALAAQQSLEDVFGPLRLRPARENPEFVHFFRERPAADG